MKALLQVTLLSAVLPAIIAQGILLCCWKKIYIERRLGIIFTGLYYFQWTYSQMVNLCPPPEAQPPSPAYPSPETASLKSDGSSTAQNLTTSVPATATSKWASTPLGGWGYCVWLTSPSVLTRQGFAALPVSLGWCRYQWMLFSSCYKVATYACHCMWQ